MTETKWISITEQECSLLKQVIVRALANDLATKPLRQFLDKLEKAALFPKITIGVYGGQVQWADGNPFPIRVCDYDGEEKDLPSVDENGHRCRMWFEPSDMEAML